MLKQFIKGLVFGFAVVTALVLTGLIKASWPVSIAGGICVGVLIGIVWGLLERKSRAKQGVQTN